MNVGNEKLGFLPGEVGDKTAPYSEQFNEYMNEFLPMLQFADEKKMNRDIEFIPLAYIRGRNFSNTIIIADEMQNSTQLQMKTLLTRLADDSKIMVLGDTKQSDRVEVGKSGLQDLVDKVKASPNEAVGVVTFVKEDIMRSEIVKYVLKLYGDID